MIKTKKTDQLGMNPSTANHRLTKDILFHLMCNSGLNACHHCGKAMTRDDYSIEHKTPWLDSDDPIGLFFSMDNIGFSHLSCNASAARRTRRVTREHTLERKRRNGRKYYDPAVRSERYQRNGK